MTVSWPSFVLGLVIGFVLGAGAVHFFKKNSVPGDQILAWTISLTWVIWHIAAALSIVAGPPPTMYDVVSGGAVGFILGERFWNGVGGFIKK